MMDAKLAAASPNLDLKIPIKQGGKSDKGPVGDGKNAFRNALDERVSARDNPPGRIAIKTATERLQDQKALREVTGTVGMTETAPAPATSAAKPIVVLSQSARLAAANEVKPKAEGQPDGDMVIPEKNSKSAHGPEKTAKAEARQERQDEDDTDSETLPSGKSLPEGRIVAEAARHHGKIKHEAGETDADDSGNAAHAPDTPVKDALVLLKQHEENGSSAAAMGSAHGQPSAEDSQAGEESHSQGRGAVYRVARADGRGQTVEIEHSLGRDAGEKAGLGKPDVNNVVVVEQRRFLAPAADNAQSIAANIAGDSEWARALQPDQALANAASQAGNGKVVNTLKIQLHPIELGLVTATLRLVGDELSVELKVDTGIAYRSLKEDQARIVEALKAHGFAVDQVNLSFGADRSDAQTSNSQNGQAQGFTQQQQQQARDGGQNAPASRERPQYERQRNGNGTASGDDLRVEAGGTGGPGAARPGHIYL